jgi:hypothetical protein
MSRGFVICQYENMVRRWRKHLVISLMSEMTLADKH